MASTKTTTPINQRAAKIVASQQYLGGSRPQVGRGHTGHYDASSPGMTERLTHPQAGSLPGRVHTRLRYITLLIS